MREEDDITSAFLGAKERLKGIVRKITKSSNDVEDILQDTYVKTYCAAKKGAINTPSAFLAKTARNLALNHINSYRQKHVGNMGENVDQLVIDSSAGVEDQLVSQHRFLDLCIAVRTLPPKCRKVFILKKVYGYTHKEIALELAISEKTIEKHISKGMIHCVKYFASLDNGNVKESTDIASEPRKIKR